MYLVFPTNTYVVHVFQASFDDLLEEHLFVYVVMVQPEAARRFPGPAIATAKRKWPFSATTTLATLTLFAVSMYTHDCELAHIHVLCLVRVSLMLASRFCHNGDPRCSTRRMSLGVGEYTRLTSSDVQWLAAA